VLLFSVFFRGSFERNFSVDDQFFDWILGSSNDSMQLDRRLVNTLLDSIIKEIGRVRLPFSLFLFLFLFIPFFYFIFFSSAAERTATR